MRRRGFTLIELILALAASAVLLAGVYGLFSKAIHLRNSGVERTRAARVRLHAISVLRNDLSHALISGGKMAAILEGSKQGEGNFPGYLKFITTTQRDILGDNTVPANDLQQVEYYIVKDPDSDDAKSGMLVRAVNANVLAQTEEEPVEETLLTGLESMTVEFYDGSSWQESWEYTAPDTSTGTGTAASTTTTTTTSSATTLPQAIRVTVQPTMVKGESKPMPIEVLVPWGTQPAIVAATTTTTTTGGTGQ